MRKVLVVDWLDKYGGAERVIAHLQRIFDFEETYCLINRMKNEDLKKIFPNHSKINETKLKFFNSKFRLLFPSFFYLIRKIRVNPEIQLIISSSHSVAKGIKKSNPDQLHISYFQNKNVNYIWDEYELFFGKWRFLFYPFIWVLRKIDIKQAQNPDMIITNSVFVQEWVQKIYKRESIVIYPPVDLKKFVFKQDKEDYFVCIGRAAKIKRFELIIKTFNENGKKLKVIGDGEEISFLKSISNPNIEFLGYLESQKINIILGNAKAMIQMGVEGFGIAVLEAQACGTPVLAYAKGGVLETVIHEKTGILFQDQSILSLQNAINHLERCTFKREDFKNNIEKYSIENFEKKMSKIVQRKLIERKKNY